MAKKYDIEHLQQPDDESCVMACVAMLVGLPVDHPDIVRFHRDYFQCMAHVSTFCINRAGVHYVRSPLTEERAMIHGRVYDLTVPSLNHDGGTHGIVADFRDVLELYDPQKGVPGKRFYGEGGEPLRSYSMATEIRNYDTFRRVMEATDGGDE